MKYLTIDNVIYAKFIKKDFKYVYDLYTKPKNFNTEPLSLNSLSMLGLVEEN